MPDDLSSIEGLADKHVRALARQHVTDLRGLVQADPEAIYRAMANLRPRPAREQIARWQDDARNKLATPAASEWQTAASFVVVYSQRKEGDTWERRVEAERTEVEPERTMQVWSGWDAAPVCDWMRGQLGQAADAGCLSPRKSRRGGAGRGGASRGGAGRGEPRPAQAAPAPAAGPGPAAYRQRRAHRRGRADGGGNGRRARREPAHRAGRAGPRGLHRRRRAAGDAAAGGRPHPAPGRTRLEPPGSGGPGRAGPVEAAGFDRDSGRGIVMALAAINFCRSEGRFQF